jgi:hypothetical protein
MGPIELTRMVTRLARYAVAGALLAGHAFAQTADPRAIDPADLPDFSVLGDAVPDVPMRAKPVAPKAGAADQAATIGSRTEKADGSVAGSAGQRLPVAWETKVGVDFGLAAPATVPRPEALLPGAQDRGTGWANVAVPAAPIGWDKATIDARVDPSQDQGRLSTSLSRAVPIGGGLSLVLQNGYSVTQTLANPGGTPATPAAAATPGTRVFAGDGAVRLELPTATAYSAGARMSSADDKMLRMLSAEQKLFDTPFSVTGAISERPTGDTDRSIKAGFKRTW